MNTLAALLTPTLTCITVYIAYRQWQDNHLRLKIENYERRLRVPAHSFARLMEATSTQPTIAALCILLCGCAVRWIPNGKFFNVMQKWRRWKIARTGPRDYRSSAIFSAAPTATMLAGARWPSCLTNREDWMALTCSQTATDSFVRPPSPEARMT